MWKTIEFEEKVYPSQMLSKDEIFSFKEKIKYYETFFFDFNDSSIIYSLEKINNDKWIDINL